MRCPKWLDEIIGSVCDACICDVKGRMSGFFYRLSKPEGNSWGAWLLMIAPSVVEISGGKNDGATGFDFFGLSGFLLLLGKAGIGDSTVSIGPFL